MKSYSVRMVFDESELYDSCNSCKRGYVQRSNMSYIDRREITAAWHWDRVRFMSDRIDKLRQPLAFA